MHMSTATMAPATDPPIHPHIYTPVRPPVEKTILMRDIEAAYNSMDIRDIILMELQRHRTDRSAVFTIANRVVRVLDISILSIWIRRLGILEDARLARSRRAQSNSRIEAAA